MSQTKHEILALLAEAGTEPRHRFGQNFMIDQNLVRIVADAGRVEPGDVVIEVGPGTGTLTDELLARVTPGGRIVAIEIDRDLAGLLRNRFAGRDDFTLIQGDALAGKHELNAQLLSVLDEHARFFPPPVLRGRAREGVSSNDATLQTTSPAPRQHEPSAYPPNMKNTEIKHASACHPRRGEEPALSLPKGSLPSATEEALRCAQGDGYSRQSPFQNETKGERDAASPADVLSTPVVNHAREEPNPALEAAGRVKLVANLPYNIASPLVIELLIAGVDLLAFTVQKEVADRLRAPAGSDDYGPLSVMAQLLARVQVLRTLPPQAFWPAPRIDSALVCLTRDDRLGSRANPFSAFVHKLFSFRRKTLRKALAQAGFDAQMLLAATGFDGQLRPEAFTPEQLLLLYCASGQTLASREMIDGSSSPATSSRTDSTK